MKKQHKAEVFSAFPKSPKGGGTLAEVLGFNFLFRGPRRLFECLPDPTSLKFQMSEGDRAAFRD